MRRGLPAMLCDKSEQIDQALLPRGQRTDRQTLETRAQLRRGARCISVRPQNGNPGEHVGFGIVRLAAVLKGGFDEAARIDPIAIADTLAPGRRRVVPT